MRHASIYPSMLLAAALCLAGSSRTSYARTSALEPATADIAAPVVNPLAATATAAMAAFAMIVCLGVTGRQGRHDGESATAMDDRTRGASGKLGSTLHDTRRSS